MSYSNIQGRVYRSIMTFVFLTMSVSFAFGPLYAAKEAAGDDLDLSLADLLDFKITVASKTEEKISDAPGVVSVITQDELKRFGGTTLADVLKRVPSFLGSTVYLTDRSIISSRGDQVGVTSNHVLLLINGRPVREVLEGGIKSDIYESFPVNIIERIEVIRGPGSVLYGTQAFSAVINVITKSTQNNSISVSGALGEGLKNNIMGSIQHTSGDVGIMIAARYADKGEWKTEYNAPADIPGATSGVVHHIDVKIPDYGPGTYVEANYKDIRLMGSYTEWNNHSFSPAGEWLNTAGIIKDHAMAIVGWKKLFGDLGYKHKFTNWYNMSVNGTYNQSMFKALGFPFIERNSYEALVEWTNFFAPLVNFNIVVGAEYGLQTGIEQTSNQNTTTTDDKGHYGNCFSGYAQTDYHWEWCKVIGGLQVNKVLYIDSLGKKDEFDVDFNPRVGIILYPLEHINIKSLFSTAYRAPSINELYLNNSFLVGKMIRRNDISWYPGHQYDLKPEKVNTVDIGANYLDEKVQFGFNGFYSRMRNLIYQRILSPTMDLYDNMGEVTILGMECEGEYRISKRLFFEGSFLYQQSRNITSGEDNVTPLPNFSAKGGLSYQSEWGLTLSGFNTFQQSLDPKYHDPLNKNTTYFNMANMHCSYDLNKVWKLPSAKELSLVFNIDNLFDKEIWLPCWGFSNNEMIPYNQGRTIYAGFKVVF